MVKIKNNVVGSTYLYRTELKPFQDDIKDYDASLNKKLQDAIMSEGFDAPLYIRYEHDNYILDGHQRLIALDALADKGYMLSDDKVPVVYIKAKTLEAAKKKLLRYNSRYADFNMSKLTDRSAGLDLSHMNIEGLGIPEMDPKKEEKEDDVPEVITPPIVKLGDIFQVGPHTIMCGDSTNSDNINNLMSNSKAEMVWTDPPYNVAYHGHAKRTKKGIANDNMESESFFAFLSAAFSSMKDYILAGGGIYIRHNHKEQMNFERSLIDNGFEIKNQIVWNKPSMGLGGGDYRPKHELCFYCCAKGSKTIFYGDRANSTVENIWEDKTDEQILAMITRAREAEKRGKTTIFSMRREDVGEYIHPTQKPVGLCELSVINSSKEGDTVLDLFLGSGSCLITCEKTRRVCKGMELDPHYIEVILKRYYEYTDGSKEIHCLNRSIDLSPILS